MTRLAPLVDGALVAWGERLFYLANRIVKPQSQPRLDILTRRKAAVIRQRIRATVSRRAPQVMVKVTGGGRGMGAIAAHFSYISKNGRLAFEDDRDELRSGKDAVHDLAEQWRFSGSLIEDISPRREAFNIMLSMPRGTDAQLVLKAAREFAKTELAGHRYVIVLHDHQANPHVHLSVRAESSRGDRLNPRKADLQRWRETFAERLRGWGVEAEATRQATRGENRNFEPIWRVKAREEGRLRYQSGAGVKSGARFDATQKDVIEAWVMVWGALSESADPADQQLAVDVRRFAFEAPVFEQWRKRAERLRQQQAQQKPQADRKAPLIDKAPKQRSDPQPVRQHDIEPRDRRGPEMKR